MKQTFLIILLVITLVVLTVSVANLFAEQGENTFVYQDNGNDGLYVFVTGVPGTSATISPLVEEIARRDNDTLVFDLKSGDISSDISYVENVINNIKRPVRIIAHDRGGLVAGNVISSVDVSTLTLLNSLLVTENNNPFPHNIIGSIIVNILYSETPLGSFIILKTLEGGGIKNVTREMIPDQKKYLRVFFKRFKDLDVYSAQAIVNIKDFRGSTKVIWGMADTYLDSSAQLEPLSDIEVLYVKEAPHFIGYTHAREIVELLNL